MPALRGRMHDLASELADRAADTAADAERAARLADRCHELEERVAAVDADRGAAARAPAVEAAAAEIGRGGPPRAPLLAAAGAGIALAVAGVIAGISALIGLGALVAVAAGAWALGGRRSPGGRELERLLPGEGPLAERLSAFRAAVERDHTLQVAEGELGTVRVEAADIRARLAGRTQLESELIRVRERVATALAGCDIDPADLDTGLRRYDEVAAAAQTHREATLTRTRASDELRRLLGDDSLEAARERLAQLVGRLNGHAELAVGRDPDDVERDLERARAQRDGAAAESERLTAAVAERLRGLPELASLREELDAADEHVARLRHIDQVLRLAESELAEAATETYRDFAPRLNASLEAGIARLTGGRYSHAFVDEDLRVRLEAPETGAVVDLDRLSVGTQKQAYLVQRLELVRLLCAGDEPLPVLLDDPFAHFDDERLERTLAWLAEAASERQIILFATQRRVAELAPADAVVVEL
ncbi:MAG TPA: hypothetical protein VGL44_01970, partial [Gaiellales bacterium]